MNKILYNYLEQEWRKSNHANYQHLFKEWIINLTISQINGFEKMMNTKI